MPPSAVLISSSRGAPPLGSKLLRLLTQLDLTNTGSPTSDDAFHSGNQWFRQKQKDQEHHEHREVQGARRSEQHSSRIQEQNKQSNYDNERKGETVHPISYGFLYLVVIWIQRYLCFFFLCYQWTVLCFTAQLKDSRGSFGSVKQEQSSLQCVADSKD